ncbi:MAG: CPXCG motif-containing cysteine-rich protein [Planctomycetes bacterium]|nr:CPXCG motif-containing cysteine-rich protein [Planctomycetota bacterium]
MLPESDYVCAACGELIVIPIDPSAGEIQDYVEDCPVCCRPNVLRVTANGDGTFRVDAESEA